MRRGLSRTPPRTAGPGATMTGTPLPPTPRATPMPGRLVRWALYGFVFSLAFDAPGRLPLELTTMTGALFLLVTLLQPRVCYGQRPAAFWWFLVYLYMYWLAYVLGGGHHVSDAVRSFLFYFQGLLIFLACFNLLRDEYIATRVLRIVVIATAILAVMTILGIATKVGAGSQRVTVFGQNPNRAAVMLGAGLLALVGLTYGRAHSAIRHRFIVWPLAAMIGLAMVKGGSRGGILAMAAGLWMFAFGGRTFLIRLRNAAVAVLAIAFCVWLMFRSPVMARRISAAEGGDLAGRQKIFPAAWGMFREKPLIGWGPNNQYVLAVRLRLPPELWTSRDTHNLVLEVLTGTGLMGFVPFFIGIWLCVRAAWKARAGPQGILPFAMLAALAVANMSGNWIVLKLQWVILAYAMASARPLVGWWPTPPIGTAVPQPRKPRLRRSIR